MVELEKVINSSAKGSMYLFIGRLISEILNAAGAVYVGRTLAADQYGILSLYYLVPWTFDLFTNLGLNYAVTRLFAYNSSRNQWNPIKKVLKTTFLVKIIISFIISYFVVIYSDTLAEVLLNRIELGYIVRYSAVLIIAQACFSILQSVCAGLDRMDYLALMGVLMSLTKASVSIYFVYKGYGAQGAFTGHLLGTGLVVIITLGLVMKYIYNKKTEDEVDVEAYDSSLFGMFKFGFPLYIGSLISGSGQRYISYLIALFSTNVELGSLDVSKKFVSLLSLFITPITSVIFPAFSKFNIHKERDEVESIYRFSIRYATLLIIPVMMAIILFADPGINFLYDYKYADAPLFLQLLLLQYIIVSMGSLSMGNLLNSQGKTTTTFRLTIINTVINTVLSFFMISNYGLIGYFISVIISEIIGTLLSFYVTRNSYNIDYNYVHSIRVILFSVISAILTYSIMLVMNIEQVLPYLVVGTLLYISFCLILAPLLGALTKEDVDNIRMLLKSSSRKYSFIEPFFLILEKLVNTLGRNG